ncbi:hypothetical protein C4A21_04501 [Escherichia coli]|nr:hypothetical protein C4A21_04501 [Escherichia coli]CTZ68585.1 Uncharacterised protein [Escherichia coli]SQP89179.1 Uncharacterised protein [Escherichia coli]
MCGLDKMDLFLIITLSVNFGVLLGLAVVMQGYKRK